MSKASTCFVTKQVCAAIVKILLLKYIRFPSSNGLTEVVDAFKHKWGFPQSAGTVDGTHISILSPQEFPSDYYNRKGWHSALMQGTVNHLGLFMDVYTGWPSRAHDARVRKFNTV